MSSTKSKKLKPSNKDKSKPKYFNRTYKRVVPSNSQVIGLGSGSLETVPQTSRRTPRYFTDDPLEWDDSRKNFEADLLKEGPQLLEYNYGRHNNADRLTIARAIGLVGEVDYQPEMKATHADFLQMSLPERTKFLQAADKMIDRTGQGNQI
jgi:hypothetical protein